MIEVDYIARVEGQGSINIVVDRGKVKKVEFAVFEPPKFFEAFLIGRKFDEVMEITSRICGICPVAHQITALRAIEKALALTVSQQTRDLRRLLALSGHISSATLSMYFLSLPDLMGYESALTLATKYPKIVKRGFRLKKLGNDITDLVGERAVHPVTAVVNKFTKIPSKQCLDHVKERLNQAKIDAERTVEMFAELPFPNLQSDEELVALTHPKKYAINEGRLVSNKGLDTREEEYRKYIVERQVKHSTAKHSLTALRGSFMVGPLARVTLNYNQLSDEAKRVAETYSFKRQSSNPFISHLARAIEVLDFICESIVIIDRLSLKEESRSFKIKAGFGHAITEAPRGILYHSYNIDGEGIVRSADIVPPTAHNAKNIEKDMHLLVEMIPDLSVDEMTHMCEMLIRAYDPCISCSVH